MSEPTFDDLINMNNPQMSPELMIDMLTAETERNKISLRLECVRMSVEHCQNRMQYGTKEDMHGGDLIRLAAGIYNYVTKEEKSEEK